MHAASITATVQRLWDAIELTSYRKALADNAEYMEHHKKRVAAGETIWVDCHNQRLALLPDGLLRIGRDLYQVLEAVEDKGYLRCICAQCSLDMSFCQVNHQIRLLECTYRQLVERANHPPTNLADGTVIRFEHPLKFTDGTQHNTFRKDSYRKRVWHKGSRVYQQRTAFIALDNDALYHITHWKRLKYEIVSSPTNTAP